MVGVIAEALARGLASPSHTAPLQIGRKSRNRLARQWCSATNHRTSMLREQRSRPFTVWCSKPPKIRASSFRCDHAFFQVDRRGSSLLSFRDLSSHAALPDNPQPNCPIPVPDKSRRSSTQHQAQSHKCARGGKMFHQLLTPVADNLTLSFIVAMLPVATVLVLLGVLRRPAWQASLAGLIVGLIIAATLWQFPIGLALDSMFNGVVFALWPVMWIVFNALLLYNVAVSSGRFDAFRTWLIRHLPDDRRVILIVIGFCFGALLEGIAGFGTPVAITSSLLILVGFPPLEALVFVLIFNTAPVAFGALGVPVTVLGAVTNLPPTALAQMIGRQLPVMALILPFYVIGLYGGLRSIRALWPVILVSGGSFAIAQFLASNFINYTLTDVLASLGSLAVTLLFLQVWRPAPDPAFRIQNAALDSVKEGASVPAWQGWLPWLIVSAVVILWTTFKIAAIGQMKIPWPGLDKAVAITLYNNMPYGAVWTFEPLATGTAILGSAILTALILRMKPATFVSCIGRTFGQSWIAIITVCLIVGLAYLMNYSGLAYTLGLGAASAGHLFVLLSPFLGWLAVFLSGSDTSGNALFGNLQVVAAKQLNLNPVLFAAANSSGGVMGKMISPQNIATGVSVTDLKGKEGLVFARTFIHSIVFTLLLGILVAIQQYIIPGIIPHIAPP
jgi:lactate permease